MLDPMMAFLVKDIDMLHRQREKAQAFLWQTINSNFSSGEGVNQRNY
jgi:hypothetical protein